jgi:hypothetical protein
MTRTNKEIVQAVFDASAKKGPGHRGLTGNSGKHVIGNKVLRIFDHIDLDQPTCFCQ